MDYSLFIAQSLFESKFRAYVPRDTGNMRYNATTVKRISKDTMEIVVDSRIAPYVVYTNEPWISPKWKGKENPNEKWFERMLERYASDLANQLGGKLIIE